MDILLKQKDIDKILKVAHNNITNDSRDASFDHCYSFFRSNRNDNDIEKSCVMLWYFLSSWGMLRNGFLRKRNAKHLENLIEYIVAAPISDWEIDVDNYSPKNIERLIKIYKDIKEKIQFPGENEASITLVTKVMLGVFGNVPAFDINFTTGFSKIFSAKKPKYGFTVFNDASLNCIKEFYEANQEIINKYSSETKIFDFKSGNKSFIHYPKAKIIDLYGFRRGEIELDEKRRLTN
jgi:hypothetical protein